MLDEHVYYWAWQADDNIGNYRNPTLYRVFRARKGVVHDAPITEPMSRDEAIAYCERIVKLTEGKELR